MSRSHLRVYNQVKQEQHESSIVRDIMKDFMNNRHLDYARSEATTEPMAPAKGPTTVRLTKDVRMEAEIDDLRKELVDAHNYRDSQEEKIAVQEERLTALNGQVAKLKGIIDRKSDTNAEEMGKAYLEIEALKTLLKIYI